MIGNTKIDEHLKLALTLDDAKAWVEAHTKELQEDILNLIKINQLFNEGIDEDGQVIGFYSKLTEILSNGRKKAGDHFTLLDTGEFFDSMYINVLKDSIYIDANYTKMEDQDWWSIDILGLTEENLEIYAERIKNNFIIYARKVLGID